VTIVLEKYTGLRSAEERPMAFDEALAARVRRSLSRKRNIEEKRMFAGMGFLLNGNLLVGVRKDSLLVRLGAEQSEEALREPHVSEFTIKGRGAMKGWIVVSLEGVQSDAQLNDWIQRATKFVGALPAKEK
jgi:TfoX/Sxy family transcriptional regulator of competence genes